MVEPAEHAGDGGYHLVMGLRFGDCELDLDRFELRRSGEVVALEPRAMQILIELIDRRHQVVTKTELLDAVWGDRFVSESALTTQIKSLRRAVGDTGREQSVVKTVHGRGYMFIAPVDDECAGSDHRTGPLVGGTTTGGHGQPVIGVLPFEMLSADPSRAHVADGLTSDIVTALSKHRWLRVLTRATTSGYRGRPDAVARLRDELAVDYVIEGTVRVDDDRLRVTVSLTDATEGTSRWSDRFDRRIDELFDVLDEVTDVIVAIIEPEVGLAERARIIRQPHAAMQAWDLFHLGIAHFYRFTAQDNVEAQLLLGRARDIDPGFADAHAWWAYAVVLGMTYWETDPDPDVLSEALAATRRALAADDQNAVFHMLRGRVQLARRDYQAALSDNERAIELNPTFAAAFCGLGDSLCYEGRYDEALSQFARSVELGSHDPQRWAFLSYGALALVFAGRYEEAVEWAERATAIPNCQYWALAHKVVALAHLGRRDECAVAVTELVERCPEFGVRYARRKLFYLKRPEQLDLYSSGLTIAGLPDS